MPEHPRGALAYGVFRNDMEMESKLANEARKALIAEAKRLTREERLRAFARHCKLVTELHDAAKRVRSKSRGGA